jgi:hypothetical protein
MNAFIDTTPNDESSLSLTPKLQRLNGTCVTKRIEALEAVIQNLRSALRDAEEELRREKERQPEIGDFVRCPLTNFFGRVTKVTARPHGRAWVEITPYLTKDYPGHGTMDLYDSWEVIDPPTPDDIPWPPVKEASSLPRVSGFEPLAETTSPQPPPEEIETMLGKLWVSRTL